MRLKDNDLALLIAATDFAQVGGRPALPPIESQPLGERLYRVTIREDGAAFSTLGPLSEAALRSKGFEVVPDKDGRMALAYNTPRLTSTLADSELAQVIAVADFPKVNGRSAIPSTLSRSLRRRLYRATIRGEGGTVHAMLGPLSVAALRSQGFEVVPDIHGRMGLASHTPRMEGRNKPPMTDDELVRLIREHPFDRVDGKPVLPKRKSLPLTQRLHNAVIRKDTKNVNSGLGPLSSKALRDLGFELVHDRYGKTGLAPTTLRVRALNRASLPTAVASLTVPGPSSSRPPASSVAHAAHLPVPGQPGAVITPAQQGTSHSSAPGSAGVRAQEPGSAEVTTLQPAPYARARSFDQAMLSRFGPPNSGYGR